MTNPTNQIAVLVGTSSHVVDQVITQVQKLLDNGMWFSDACEVVSILTPLEDLFNNFDDSEKMGEFWDFISDCCTAPRGVTPRIASPMF